MEREKGMKFGANWPDANEQKETIEGIYNELNEIFKTKSDEHGNNAIHELGLKGCFNDIHRKYMRLLAHIWNSPEEEWDMEYITENTKDLTNYGAILMMQVQFIKEGKVDKF